VSSSCIRRSSLLILPLALWSACADDSRDGAPPTSDVTVAPDTGVTGTVAPDTGGSTGATDTGAQPPDSGPTCDFSRCEDGVASLCDDSIVLACGSFDASCQELPIDGISIAWCDCGSLAEGDSSCTGEREGVTCVDGIGTPFTCSAGALCDGGACVCDDEADGVCPDEVCVDDPDCGGCTPDCGERQCGDNGCGGSCGSCGLGEVCSDGRCEAGCVPSCDGLACGDDGCGGSCGSCGPGETCDDGACGGTSSAQCACEGTAVCVEGATAAACVSTVATCTGNMHPAAHCDADEAWATCEGAITTTYTGWQRIVGWLEGARTRCAAQIPAGEFSVTPIPMPSEDVCACYRSDTLCVQTYGAACDSLSCDEGQFRTMPCTDLGTVPGRCVTRDGQRELVFYGGPASADDAEEACVNTVSTELYWIPDGL